jgi:putative ABC transport system permease protein
MSPVLATIELSALDLALAASLILLNAGVAIALRLGLGRRILFASARAVLQLTLLGFVLGWVFAQRDARIVLGLMVAMALLAGFEAVRRTSHRVRGLHLWTLSIVLSSSMLVTLFATQLVLGVEPWYEPRYLIPILGMVLGNALNGVSLGLETSLAGFLRERARVELLLAHGASPWEASRDVVRDAVRTGMIPILNAMIAAGIISIPGMMTGQILSGEDPRSAAAYQVFILFCIAGGVALGTLGVVLASVRLVFDRRMRLRRDWIRTQAD